MRIIDSRGTDQIATVFVGELGEGRRIEFVESIQPPIPRETKWVLIVSVLFGCPIGCPICDAGDAYGGRLKPEELLSQIDFLIRRRYREGHVPVEKLKIQFARMGEPALNPAVLDVIERLPEIYDAPGLIPSISTIAPQGSQRFFDRLLDIKQTLYPGGRFQLQFSIHSTDETWRDRLIPAAKWSFDEIARYGERFHRADDRKITLNFAWVDGAPIDSSILREHFDPSAFLIKVTPVNPTFRAGLSKLRSFVDASDPSRSYEELRAVEEAGYDVLVSIGEVEENQIGSNCGQFVSRLDGSDFGSQDASKEGYGYWRDRLAA